AGPPHHPRRAGRRRPPDRPSLCPAPGPREPGRARRAGAARPRGASQGGVGQRPAVGFAPGRVLRRRYLRGGGGPRGRAGRGRDDGPRPLQPGSWRERSEPDDRHGGAHLRAGGDHPLGGRGLPAGRTERPGADKRCGTEEGRRYGRVRGVGSRVRAPRDRGRRGGCGRGRPRLPAGRRAGRGGGGAGGRGRLVACGDGVPVPGGGHAVRRQAHRGGDRGRGGGARGEGLRGRARRL
ncbi:MAG: hypothetical protein AVDCRST_MAG05-2303, partial [uncultured Rubrobacteraceae bacterium]